MYVNLDLSETFTSFSWFIAASLHERLAAKLFFGNVTEN